MLALSKLSETERSAIDFDQSEKLIVITNLLDAVKISEEECISKQWHYKRNGKGEKVILRDTFSKLVKWIQRFRDISDIAVQYDPVHAALPWAGVRFLLEVSPQKMIHVPAQCLRYCLLGGCRRL